MGCAFAVRRTAGPARWAFGPPGERAARTQQNGAEPLVVLWALLLAGLLRLFEPRSSPPLHAADCNSSGLVAFTAGGEQLRLRANSAIPKGIAVLGESDALVARERCAEDEPDRLGR